jgi:hypothetical protein
MNTRRHFSSPGMALASVILATLFLAACNPSQPAATSPASTPKGAADTSTSTQLYVVFEGPWAIAPDPTNPNNVLLLAPKTTSHRLLYVAASYHYDLDSGIYQLSFPGAVGPGAGTYDPAFLRVTISPQNSQNALDSKAGRYAIRLPRPDAYLPMSRSTSRAGSSYPPASGQDYASGATLRYTVSSLSGFSVSGTPDSGTFNPVLLQVDTPFIHFMVEPTVDDDTCYNHSRQTFHDTVQLVGLTYYVDFPPYSDACHNTDPQIPHGAKTHASLRTRFERMAALLTQNVADVQGANAIAPPVPSRFLQFVTQNRAAQGLAAAIYYFFDVTGGGCKAPTLGGT